MLQEIKTLVQTLNEQRDAYYNKDSPKMTDKEYDRLFDRLEELEKKSGIIFSNSPTQSVGYYPVSELAKVRHTRALLSLEKTKQIRELADFMENQDTLLMLKLDGLTVKLVYEEGRLVQASTRGDGNVGEDITHNIPAFENVPLSISYRERLVTTGEAFIYKDDFRQLKDTIRDGNGEPYKNARNLASGSVRNLNPEVCKGRHVHFIPFNVLEGMDEGTGVDSREFKLMQLGVLGFDTCPYVYMEAGKHSEKELKEQIEKLKTMGMYRNSDELGIVSVNHWHVENLRTRNRDDAGQLINSSGSVNTITGTGEGGNFFYSSPMSNRGISNVKVNYGEDSILDGKVARKLFCQACLEKLERVTETYVPEDKSPKVRDLFLIDFKTMELYSLQGQYTAYMIRDYYVQIDYQEEGLKVTAFYAPILENGEKRIE